MKTNKTLSPIVIVLFLRRKKLNISVVSISQFYFKVSKTIILSEKH